MKQNLKPFDLEAALQGAAVTTKAGHEVAEVFCYKSFKGNNVIAVINCVPRLFSEDGKCLDLGNFSFDLFMKPQQVTKWVNVYVLESGYFTTGEMFDTQKQALEEYSPFGKPIETTQITFEV